MKPGEIDTITRGVIQNLETRERLLTAALAAKTAESEAWQINFAWLMRKTGQTQVLIPGPEAKDVMQLHAMKTKMVPIRPDGAGEEVAPVPGIHIELISRQQAKAEHATAAAAKPILRVVR